MYSIHVPSAMVCLIFLLEIGGLSSVTITLSGRFLYFYLFIYFVIHLLQSSSPLKNSTFFQSFLERESQLMQKPSIYVPKKLYMKHTNVY